MLQALGKVGKVLKVYADGDLRVSFGSQVWTFNSAACRAVPHHEQDENNTLTRTDRDDHPSKITNVCACVCMHFNIMPTKPFMCHESDY